MPRLVEYVVLVGYDFEKSIGSEGFGRVVQRFPTKSWSDYPYDFHLETFCQPWGWQLSTSRSPPTFFVAYLTDMVGNSYFAACLTFHEPVTSHQMAISDTSRLVHRTGLLNGGSHLLRLPRTQGSPAGSSVHSFESLASCDMGLVSQRDRPITHPGFNHEDPNLVRPPELYAPKCLVLLARHQHFDILKNSLSLLYTVFADSLNQYSMEQIIATMLGAVDVPPTGGPRLTFSLGVGDRQVIQPANCDTIPVTRNYVALLFKHLGIHNVILLFSAILSDQKVLLCSRSLNRLTESCQALTAIIYPLKYGHTFVPILPKGLIEYINAPTPFLYGIHTSYRHVLPELMDVFVADLDGGSVICPENIPLPQLPEPYFDEVVESLFQILSPELLTSDHMYPPKQLGSPNDLFVQDKQLRAVFVRLFASLFSGYRSCLNITRIHPQPVFHFNQSLFLMLRRITAPNDFFERLLSSMRFQQFILERGPPFRVCDLFDEVYDSAMPPNHHDGIQSPSEHTTPHSPLSAVSVTERLGQKLLENECGDKPVECVIPNEAIEAHKRIHQAPFPPLDNRLVDQLIMEASQRRNKNVQHHKPSPRFVPQGYILDRQLFKAVLYPDKNRVIREFIADIFNHHITEALKRRNTIRQDLKSRPIRRLFVDELQRYVVPIVPISPNDAIKELSDGSDRSSYEQRAILSWEQFELIVDLLDEALCQESQSEDSGIAPIVMDLCTKFTTELSSTRYYANMTPQIQRHPIWEQMSFWENVFNEHVNNQIRQLYLHFSEQEQQDPPHSGGDNRHDSISLQAPASAAGHRPRLLTVSPVSHLSTGERVITVSVRKDSNSNCQRPNYSSNMSTLEIAAEEMRIGHSRPKEVQTTLETQEESTVYAQIIHFINLIVNFRISIDVGAAVATVYGNPNESSTNDMHVDPSASGTQDGSYTNGVNRVIIRENGSVHGDRFESNWKKSRTTAPEISHSNSLTYDGETRHASERARASNVNSALEYISRLEAWLRLFVEKVTDENNLRSDLASRINEKIEGIIESHLLNLEAVYPKVKSIPKVKKPEIASPTLLATEIPIRIGGHDCVQCQLLVDGRLERTDWQWLDAAGDLKNTAQSTTSSERPSLGSPTETEVEVDAMLRQLLPAQGALFVTNYRLIFTGVPRDPYQSNKVITRSFPIAALHSIKRSGIVRITTVFPATTSTQPNPYAPAQKSATMFAGKRHRVLQPVGSNSHGAKRRLSRAAHGHLGQELGRHKSFVRIDENLDVWIVRALTMQLLRLGFDPDEVSQDTRDELRSLLLELRHPATLHLGFNLAPSSVAFDTDMNSASCDSRSLSITGTVGQFHSRHMSDEHREIVSATRTGQPASNFTSAISFRGELSPSPSSGIKSSRQSDDITLAIVAMLTNSPPGNRHVSKLCSTLSTSPGYLDLARFGLGLGANSSWTTDRCSVGTRSSLTGGGGGSGGCGARLVAYNAHYDLTRSYPALLVVPQMTSHACLSKVVRSYRHGRFPVVTWQHPVTGGYLLRASGFHSNSIVGALKHVGSSGPTANPGTEKDGSGESSEQASAHNPTKEHARYLIALVDMAFGAMVSNGTALNRSNSSFLRHPGGSPLVNSTTFAPRAVGDAVPRDKRPLSSIMGSQASGGKTHLYHALGRLAGLRLRAHRSKNTPSGSLASGLEEEVASSNSGSRLNLRVIASSNTPSRPLAYHPGTMQGGIVALYVLGEKSTIKALSKQSHLRSIEFVPVEFPSLSTLADSFKMLFKACLPTDAGKSSTHTNVLAAAVNAAGLNPYTASSQPPSQEVESGVFGSSSATGTQSSYSSGAVSRTVHTAIQDSGWLGHLKSLLELSGTVVDLLDFNGASVSVCLEDGTDTVTQVVSLAQIMLDPDYRTLKGFWTLLEKEWLLFGHPFNQRLNQTLKSEPVSPVFLQFLDAVHQLLRQFPVSFEFNDFFLEFLAYHHYSNRFHNFKYDCESERHSVWFGALDGPQSAGNSHEDQKALDSYESHSIWSYIQQQHYEWPVFFNFRYSRQMGTKVLRPATNLASLDIWRFYLNEDLATGPVYDLDHFSPIYRKQNAQPYEPVLRQGFNNTHVEQVYAILGLREGEEAAGWQTAWEQAQSELGVREQQKAIRRRNRRTSQPMEHHDRCTSGLPEYANTNRLTITVDYRERSEPVQLEGKTRSTMVPRRAVSGTLVGTDTANQTSPASLAPSNQTTMSPPENSSIHCNGSDEMVSASSEIVAVLPATRTFPNDDAALVNGTQEVTKHINNLHDPKLLVKNVHSLEHLSEDEAFHEGVGPYMNGDDDDDLSDSADSEDCIAARSIAFDYHRATTIQRLLHGRQGRNLNLDVLSPPSMETGLSSGFGCESDSLTSGSVYGGTSAQSPRFCTLASPDEVVVSNLIFATPHQFSQTNMTLSNARCQFCQNFFFSLNASRTAAKCVNCGYVCHEKCAPLAPKNCQSVNDVSAASSRHDISGGTEEERRNPYAANNRSRKGNILSPKPPWRNSRDVSRPVEAANFRGSALFLYDKHAQPRDHLEPIGTRQQISSPLGRSVTSLRANTTTVPAHLVNASFYGLLHKMSHRKLLQQWKQRFFVLDTDRHQLRYYDTEADESSRRCIDLQEVRAIRLVRNSVPHQRRVADYSVFELETSTRTYRLAAESIKEANEWVERIQNTIQ